MTTHDPLASTPTLWSLLTYGPYGFMSQFFVDAQASTASEKPEPLSAPAIPAPPLPSAVQLEDSPVSVSGPQWLKSHFEHNGESHRFKLYIPSIYHGQPLPLIVMLHGAHQDPEDFAVGTEMNEAAEANGYIVAYPEQSESVNLFRCWHWYRPGDQTRESGETSMIAALTRNIIATYHADNARVYIAGMSAGGAMAVNLVAMHPELFAAAAIHSGVAFGVADEAFSALCAMNDGLGKLRPPERADGDIPPRGMPLIVFHGDADETVHPRNADQIVAMNRLFHGDIDVTPRVSATLVENDAEGGYAYTRRLFEDASGLTIAEQWVVHGLDHAWSGGNEQGTYTDSRGPNATAEIVRFFGQFALET